LRRHSFPTRRSSDLAVVGLEATLSAVNEGRVQTLVLIEGFRKSGFREKETAALTLNANGTTEKVFDVVEQAVQDVIRRGGEVEVVRQSDAFELLGSVGAVLRY
jgi:peptide subunit release factor 1 (eRF1)